MDTVLFSIGWTVDDCYLIGMGAIVLDGARICKNSIVAAGAMVLEGFNVPEGMFVAGVPAKIKRPLNGRRKTIFTSVGCELYSLS